ncbi:hypothetical protein L6164_001278 [Bauhinia variegata]|uniref:Uncharacterized protein n=1 Tax=Bauhinia variegata TaxID=167791 RepID=A0ACB9Q917_BAUVA|nr:hypothetical protein L6164_001278 [Bauhinia variegata]
MAGERDGIIGLTRSIDVPSSSAGAVIYKNPITFFDPETNTTTSFSAKFTFSIRNVNPSSFCDGLTFFLSPSNRTLGSPGGYLGLVNSSQLTRNKFVAVEFDTRLDPRFNDPNENHVGLDIDSMNSINTADLILQGIDLKSGNLINAWIDYKNEQRKLMVFLSYSSLKPEKPILSVDINLSDYFKRIMYVGFSASTEGSTELHQIENWSFQTVGFIPARPKSRLEYLQCGMATEKTDVFSYGVVVLEVAYGRRSIEREGQKMVNLADWVWGLHSEGKIIEAADKKLKGEFKEEEMRKLLLLGLSCANPDSSERPSMRRVLQILNNEVASLANFKLAFFFRSTTGCIFILAFGKKCKTRLLKTTINMCLDLIIFIRNIDNKM